ncbi:LLM class flavin-dependent oxidoreductase [Microbacterium sp. SORGH_AS_0888]|uniref:LLM class flavin-dependent oxidoreductase n=1 Tax=Microbacterium sp. SORGH_AS_0888 TaxID=3041791 RepID=UPI0027854346|nr:LLM class flavin-dependent oxidoreductase [Microbacterium sp. SORGH_AS_0888]MDQ1128930.1 alkanesulfonate monooxygenase SsuD/methylene tetrahydromethanopterin reductase-like flavin-dependent oxidoreductase (luciferase family) [Microbacterium sp. SORGH_AS_0888]
MSLVTGFSAAPTWMRAAAWRRADSRVEHLLSGTPIVEAVVRAERAGFDLCFRPDALTLPRETIGHDPAHLGLDPIVQAAQLAGATSRITLITTVSATFTEPYPLARQLVSLEHLAPGRVGWNVVTSRSGDDQFSVARLPDSAARWRRAAELIDVVEALRASFPDGALIADRESGTLVDLDQVHGIDHVGESFRVAGPLPLPARTREPLPLLVAGGGAATVALAARRADAVFGAAVETADSVTQREAIRAAAAEEGRSRIPLFLPGLSLLLADTREEAVEIARETYEPGRRAIGPHWSVVGTPADAVASIAARARAQAIDGFIAFPIGSWRSVELVCEVVLPRLRELGLVGPLPPPPSRH